MSRTVSSRIPTKLHDELRERCNIIGESINDFVKASIEIGLYGTSDFDFGDEEGIVEPESEPQNIDLNKELPKVNVKWVSD